MTEYLVFVALFAALLAAYLYMRSMFKGRAKPNRVSWFMWAVSPFIATAAAVSNGVGWAVLPVFMAGFSPFLVFTASFAAKKAYWKLSTFNYFCGGLSGLALVLWYATKDPDVAILFAIASDGLASVPTLTKAWGHPESESGWPFMIGVFNPVTSFFAASEWTFSEIAFPAYLMAMNLLICYTIYRKKLTSILTD